MDRKEGVVSAEEVPIGSGIVVTVSDVKVEEPWYIRIKILDVNLH